VTDDVRGADGEEGAKGRPSDRERLKELLRKREKSHGDPGSGGEAKDADPGADETSPAWTPLVPIQPLGSEPPFFIVHAILGSVFPYHRLALELGTGRPVFGLQSRGLDGRQPPLETIPEMARVYVEALRSVQRTGPYHLGGYSMGGWIAYEMAQQLRQGGDVVGMLAALGTPAPLGGDAPGADYWRWGARYAEDFFRLWRNSALADSPELQGLFFGQQGFPGAAPSGAAADPTRGYPGEAPFPGVGFPPTGPAYRVATTNSLAQLLYVAEPYEGGVDVFLTTEQTTLYEGDPTMGWRNLCRGPIAVHHVHGNHLNLFHEPQVQELAKVLAQRLDEVETEGGGNGQG
jgi:thioesterase domain-containing protein